MDLDTQQNCMRVCFEHWNANDKENMDTEKLSIITYAMLLDIINKSESDESHIETHIDTAKKLFTHGKENGWMNTH